MRSWPNNNWASLVIQTVKNLPAIQETWVQSLGQEDALEKGMANHSGTLAWRIPWTEEPGRLQSWGCERVRQDWATNTSTFFFHWFTEDPSLWWALLWITAPWITSSIVSKRARIKSLHFAVGGGNLSPRVGHILGLCPWCTCLISLVVWIGGQ